jgi:lipopolysaccharide export system permease protein
MRSLFSKALMLFDSSLRKELARTFGATLVVVLTIVLTMMLIRALGQAAGGSVAPQDVALLLSYTALAQLPTILGLSLFVSVVSTLTRMYRDSEMVIWFASGASLARMVPTVMSMSWPVLFTVAVLVLAVWPWSNRQSAELRDRYERRSDLSRVAPGQFQTSGDGRRVFFIDKDSNQGVQGRNVFILFNQNERESVTTAAAGQIEMQSDGDRFLVLDHGARTDINLTTGEKTLSRFQQYRVLASDKALSGLSELPPRARSTKDLLADTSPRAHGPGRLQPGAAGAGAGGGQPAPSGQLESAFCAAGLCGVLQPREPHPSLGRSGKNQPGRRSGRCAWFGASLCRLVAVVAGPGCRQPECTAPPPSAGTVRRLLYREILSSVLFVVLAFLALFFFIDFVEQLERVGKNGYTALQALWSCVLELPGHLYELLPIAVLIGGIYALARLAQSSEYTILRTGGLGPARALRLLAILGLGFALITYVIGDHIAPWTDKLVSAFEAKQRGGLNLGRAGTWLRDSQITPEGERRYSINVGAAVAHGQLERVRIYEFGPQGNLLSRTTAARARVDRGGLWSLEDVFISRWVTNADGQMHNEDRRVPQMAWHGALSSDVVAAAMLPVKTMSTAALYTYMSHLSEHEQAAQRYEIQFWKKALYPFACLVMMALALPFAYLRSRAGGVSLKVFGGIMLGISFVLLNNVSSHLGLLRQWTPWIAASVPSVIYLVLSMGAFYWLVRNR